MPPLAFVLEHYMDGDIDGMQLAMQFVSSPIYFSLLRETARERSHIETHNSDHHKVVFGLMRWRSL